MSKEIKCHHCGRPAEDKGQPVSFCADCNAKLNTPESYARWREEQQAIDYDMDQTLGKVLGYPELYPHASEVDNGEVCTAPNLPLTLAHEAADKIKALKREVMYLRQYGNKDCTAMADKAMEDGEMDEDADDKHRDQAEPGVPDREQAPGSSE